MHNTGLAVFAGKRLSRTTGILVLIWKCLESCLVIDLCSTAILASKERMKFVGRKAKELRVLHHSFTGDECAAGLGARWALQF